MKLTLLFRSNKARFMLNLGKKQLLLALFAISIFFLTSSRSTHSPEENIARIQHAKTGFKQQAEEVSSLINSTEQRMTGMILKLADMQSQIQRLDALGSRLVKQEKFNPDEFSFEQTPGMGGPMDIVPVDIKVQDALFSKMKVMLEKIKKKS
ncbi:MAG: hypothetical protein QMC38_04520, partial [Sinobacterium sp.]